MPKLTTDEFITLYKNNSHNVLQWIQENETELPTLFTTPEISYSFYLKCIAGFAILGGGALVITAIIS